jgi:sigma-54 dependent transcriptional regulator, acetoin dehydrogenase operon transcriptional activator AcoR
MFNYEQLPIHRDILILPYPAKVEDIIVHLSKGIAVCIPADQGVYLFTNEDLWLLELNRDTSLESLTGRANWLSVVLPYPNPSIESYTQLTQMSSATQRPIVFQGVDGTTIGYCLLADLLKYYVKEEQRFSSYFFTLAETVTDAVTVVDQQGMVICWNTIAEDTYGIDKKDILGRRIGEHFNPEELMVLKILDEGRMIRNTYHRPSPGKHVLINASPIMDINGHIAGGITTEQDITQLVRLNDGLSSKPMTHYDGPSNHEDPFSFIRGKGELIGNVIRMAKKVAGAETPLLLIGEAGVGKEKLAQVIHHASGRDAKPFIAVHCGTIPAGLLETELFGFQGGAFSGNNLGSSGKIEMADQGTLFINEIDRLPLDIQTKLFQYIQQQSIVRTGGTTAITARTRIIAATDHDLQKLVEAQLFRSDLFYALSGISITLPALRERKEDIPSLVQTFLRQFALQYQRAIPQIEPEVMLAFSNYEWPGNLNELMSVVDRCFILSEDERISMTHLPLHLQKKQPQLDRSGSEQQNNHLKFLKSRNSAEDEKSLIEEALAQTFGNKSAAAKLLGISRGTLYNKMKELELE